MATEDPKHGAAGEHQRSVFYYKDSGIRERHGRIPLWLVAVALALIIWSIYYVIAYWTPPA